MPFVARRPFANPLAGHPGQYDRNPGVPNPTIVPEAFMDTPMVNGTAYPYVTVEPQGVPVPHPERLQRPLPQPAALLREVEQHHPWTSGHGSPRCRPTRAKSRWCRPSSDAPASRRRGRPTAATAAFPTRRPSGPRSSRSRTEGGFLPAPADFPTQPVDYVDGPPERHARQRVRARRCSSGRPSARTSSSTSRTSPRGPSSSSTTTRRRRFRTSTSGTTTSPGDPDLTSVGGAPTTLAGYGPNTRTLMQLRSTARPRRRSTRRR